MTIQTRTTELEAINTILSTIGEAPLSTLTGSLPVDGTMAKSVLNEINREVQSMGWHFNTQPKVTLSKDAGNSTIPLATNVLRVELNPYLHSKTDFDVVQRDNILFNLVTNTSTFTEDLKDVKVVYLLDFSEIPEQAKRYITIRSARVFHDRTLGANTLHKFSVADEEKSLVILRQAEASTGDYSVFDSPDQIYTVNRKKSNWWY